MWKHNPIPQDLLDALSYDPSSPSGLRWREGGRGRRKDLQCGSKGPKGYYDLTWGPTGGKTRQRAHRVVWALHHGDPGKLVVDHINCDPSDNRIENLQAIPHRENRVRKTGVGFSRRPNGRFEAYVSEDSRKVHLGTFATEEEARAAYVDAKAKLAEGLEVDFA